MHQFITGIQQAGIGVTDADVAKYVYRDLFGMDVLVFDDSASADLMKQFTGNIIHQRRAILSINMQGGGGFELWQFTSRKPSLLSASTRLGDIGIFAIKIKTADIQKAHAHFTSNTLVETSPVFISPNNKKHFWVKDTYGNHFDIVEHDCIFNKTKSTCGGVTGAVIGVTDMDKALDFYTNILAIDKVVYDIKETINDCPYVNETGIIYRRVLITKVASASGAFSRLLGDVQIELVQATNYIANKIFHNRYWGDCGFIHLCFDVTDMDALKKHTAMRKRSFSVDSADSFSMGDSTGRFCYIEDPDGTL